MGKQLRSLSEERGLPLVKSDRLAPVRFLLVKSLSKESGFHLRSSEALLEVDMPRLDSYLIGANQPRRTVFPTRSRDTQTVSQSLAKKRGARKKQHTVQQPKTVVLFLAK